MRPLACFAGLVALWTAAFCGCSPNGSLTNQQATWNQQHQQQVEQYAALLRQAERRAGNLNLNNVELNSQLAQSQQQLQRITQENALLKQRLSETASKLADTLAAKQNVDQRIEALEASARLRGGASITANNSLDKTLPKVEIPDVEVRREGDVIRITLPADRLFLPGSAVLHQGAFPLIDKVAAALKRDYPQQIVVIEGHTDSSPPQGGPGSSNMQISIAQAMAVYQQLTTRYAMSASQLRVLGEGDGMPLYSNAIEAGRAKNRRIDIAIYPEKVGVR